MVGSISELKRNLLKSFDSIYLDIFQFGVKRLSIDILGNKILIVGEHARLPGLQALDHSQRFVTRLTDVALLDECKVRLKQAIEEKMPDIRVLTVLNDYDPHTEIAATIIVTEGELLSPRN